MNISMEKFTVLKEEVKAFSEKSRKMAAALKVCGKLLLAACIVGTGIALGFRLYIILAVPGILCAVMLLACFICYTIENNFSEKQHHFRSTIRLIELQDEYNNKYMMPPLFNKMKEFAAVEKDRAAAWNVHYRIFMMSLLSGDINGAACELIYDKALFSRDRFFEFMYYCGRLSYFCEIGDIDGVEECYQNVWELFDEVISDSGSYLGYLTAMGCEADYCGITGRYEEALKYLDLLHDESANSRPELRINIINEANYHHERAVFLYHLGRYEEALEHCDRAGKVFGELSLNYLMNKANRTAERIVSAMNGNAVIQ